MIELRLTLDLSDRFADVIDRLASAIESSGCACSAQTICEHVENVPEISPESVSPVEAGSNTPADEIAQGDIKESPESASVPEPVEPPREQVAPAPVEKPVEKPAEVVEKPKRSRTKKADAPKPEAETVDPLTGEVLPDKTTEPAEKIDTPAASEPVTPAADSDPMQGMNVIQALQAITREASERGVDMAAMNGRIRAKADELGLPYGSAACLIKAVGYVEARRVALGER